MKPGVLSAIVLAVAAAGTACSGATGVDSAGDSIQSRATVTTSAETHAVSSRPGAPATGTGTGTGSATPAGPRNTCQLLLPGRLVQAWQAVTVRDLRGYQYGGPVARFPLTGAFPGARADQAAAWCWVRTAQQTGSLWGVVPGHGTGRAITVTGPGWQPHGIMSSAPRVP